MAHMAPLPFNRALLIQIQSENFQKVPVIADRHDFLEFAVGQVPEVRNLPACADATITGTFLPLYDAF